MDALPLGTLYDSLRRTVSRWSDRPAYAVPPMAGRAYHPDGKEYSWNEVAQGVEKMRTIYARAGFGMGHRVAILFDQRPEFFFHYYALNSLGCSVVPINPDYRKEEIQYVVEHSESSLAISVDKRIGDFHAIATALNNGLAVVSFENFPDTLPAPRTPAAPGMPASAAKKASAWSIRWAAAGMPVSSSRLMARLRASSAVTGRWVRIVSVSWWPTV